MMHNIFEIKHTSSSDRNLELCHHFMGSWFAVLYFVSTILYFLSITPLLPVMFTLPWGGFVFCIGPGFAMYSLLSLRQESHFSYLTLLILSCSLGFSFNFLANIAIYVLTPSLLLATKGFLVSVCIIYAILLYVWTKRGDQLFVAPESYNYTLLAFGALFALIFTVILYYKETPAYYIEELMVLRKLFENPEVMATNLAFHQGVATTYYFIPFFQFIGMSAIFAGVDIFRAIHGLWPFTAAVSLLCLVGIMRLLNGHPVAIAALLAMSFFHAIFLPQPPTNWFTLFSPWPDRYGMPNGVLIPLALFHFLIHMGEKKINLAAFVGLIYLITEVTFIHARETIHFIGIIMCVVLLMLFDFKQNSRALSRIFWLLSIVGGILLIYRQINLSLQPELLAYVFNLKEEMRASLIYNWNLYGLFGVFGFPQYEGYYSYGERFKLLSYLPGLNFISITVIFLPFYVFFVERMKMLVAPTVIVVFGLYSLFPGIRLITGIMIGSPFIFDMFSILYLFALIVFVDMIRLLLGFMISSHNRLWNNLVVFIILGSVMFYQIYYGSLANNGFATGSPYSEIVIYVFALSGIVIKTFQLSNTHVDHQFLLIRKVNSFISKICLRLNQPKTAINVPYNNQSRKAMVISAIMIGIVFCSLAPVLDTFFFKTKRNVYLWGAFAKFSHIRYANNLIDDYNKFAEQSFAVSEKNFKLPPALISYIRNEIPLMQTWFGGDTALIQLISSQYSPIITFCGELHAGFEANIVFAKEFKQNTVFDKKSSEKGRFVDFLENETDIPRLFALLDKHQVQWIITRPEEKDRVEALLVSASILQKRLRKAFETDGYMIFQLLRSDELTMNMQLSSATN